MGDRLECSFNLADGRSVHVRWVPVSPFLSVAYAVAGRDQEDDFDGEMDDFEFGDDGGGGNKAGSVWTLTVKAIPESGRTVLAARDHPPQLELLRYEQPHGGEAVWRDDANPDRLRAAPDWWMYAVHPGLTPLGRAVRAAELKELARLKAKYEAAR